MTTIGRALSIAAVTLLAALPGSVLARGSGGSGKAGGWSLTPATNTGIAPGSSSKATGGRKPNAKGGASQAYPLPAGSAAGMGGMMMTPNGMIVRNTPPMAVANSANMGGASLVAHMAPGIGSAAVTSTTRGIGNSQGSGGTIDIAAMTHFGVSGLSTLGALLGGNGLSRFLSPATSTAGSTPGSGSTAKGSAMGMPFNAACASGAGRKSGCN